MAGVQAHVPQAAVTPRGRPARVQGPAPLEVVRDLGDDRDAAARRVPAGRRCWRSAAGWSTRSTASRRRPGRRIERLARALVRVLRVLPMRLAGLGMIGREFSVLMTSTSSWSSCPRIRGRVIPDPEHGTAEKPTLRRRLRCELLLGHVLVARSTAVRPPNRQPFGVSEGHSRGEASGLCVSSSAAWTCRRSMLEQDGK